MKTTTGRHQHNARQLPFFVYGSLRRGQGNHRLLAGKTVGEHPARLHGCALYTLGLPFATPGGPESYVVGELMVVAEDHYASVLAALDRLEGYRGPGRTNLYERVSRRVSYTDKSGQTREAEAWVYLAGADVALCEDDRVAGGDWLQARGALAAFR